MTDPAQKKKNRRPMSPRRKKYWIALGLAGVLGGVIGILVANPTLNMPAFVGFEVNGNSVYLQGIYPATSEQALVVDAVFNMTSVEPVAEAVTGTAESACGISLVSDKVWLESWFDLEVKFADQMAHVAEDDKSDTRFLLYRDQVIDVRECETSSVPGWDLQFGLSGGTQMLFIRLSDDGDHVALGLE